MGLVCQLVFTPVFKRIHAIVTVVEVILVQVCRLIQELVNVVTEVLTYVCNTVVHTVCSAVCSVVCGICDLFCGIFGCDCGCENVCNNVCDTVTDVVCGWTYVLQTVAQRVDAPRLQLHPAGASEVPRHHHHVRRGAADVALHADPHHHALAPLLALSRRHLQQHAAAALP